MQRVEGVLKQHNAYAATFYEIGQHTPVAGIRGGLKVFKETGADVIVAVGGGSPIDASKAILYFYQQETGGEFLPQIAIPTTLSAAEYTVRGFPTTHTVMRSIPGRSVQGTRMRKGRKLRSTLRSSHQRGSSSTLSLPSPHLSACGAFLSNSLSPRSGPSPSCQAIHGHACG